MEKVVIQKAFGYYLDENFNWVKDYALAKQFTKEELPLSFSSKCALWILWDRQTFPYCLYTDYNVISVVSTELVSEEK